ncbi:hypothetical protein DJ73_14495 [Halorubrum sp. Ea1]|nr:hypothetical protein DJ73_14495 [Halorubrum sp. Ea1]
MEAFTVDPLLTIYKRAAGALEAFTVDPLLTIYKRAVGAPEASTADPSSTTYNRSTSQTLPRSTPFHASYRPNLFRRRSRTSTR